MQYQGLRIHNMKQTLKNQRKHITTLSQNIHLALEIIRSLLKYVDWEGIKMVFFLLRLYNWSSSYIELVFLNKKLTLIYVAIFNEKNGYIVS